MRHQRGFTLMELMVAGAVITALSVVGISFLVSERESGRIKQVQIEMLNIADVTNQYRKSIDSSSGTHFNATAGTAVSVINSTFGTSLAETNPWGNAYTVEAGNTAAIVTTVVPVPASPPGFEATTVGGGTQLRVQSVRRPTSIQSRRARHIKALIYEENTR
ncbi:MAG: type II secretion system protein [Salinisphaeraceae bacterium]